MRNNKSIAIIGAGVMGLACAYELIKNGYDVEIYEADDRIGGMSAAFNFDGLKIERYYHFVCGPDNPLFDLLKELNIYDHLKWTETKMGFYYEGKLYKWGNPLYLMRFPELDILSKLKYGWHIFKATKRKKWEDLDRLDALSWIKENVGEKAYNTLWKSLFNLKFYEFKNNLSAAWIWTRLKRVGVSRKNIFTERMGYIQGGSTTLLNSLQDKILGSGGKIHLNTTVKKVEVSANKVSAINIKGKKIKYNRVISTVPLPYITKLIPQLSKSIKEKYNALQNIGVVCVIFKLSKPLTENFWLNINDSSMELPGIIEYSNLNPLDEKIIYAPFYLHKKNPLYSQSDKKFISKVISYCKSINKEFREEWIQAKHVHRYEYAQPVCPPQYLDYLPSIKTEINGLYIADTSHYYPEDRSISESVRVGRKIAKMITG